MLESGAANLVGIPTFVTHSDSQLKIKISQDHSTNFDN